MIRIDISEDAPNASKMADMLRNIADMIDEGFTSGYYPSWSLEGEE